MRWLLVGLFVLLVAMHPRFRRIKVSKQTKKWLFIFWVIAATAGLLWLSDASEKAHYCGDLPIDACDDGTR